MYEDDWIHLTDGNGNATDTIDLPDDTRRVLVIVSAYDAHNKATYNCVHISRYNPETKQWLHPYQLIDEAFVRAWAEITAIPLPIGITHDG